VDGVRELLAQPVAARQVVTELAVHAFRRAVPR
jgi:hypothetical protein